MLHHTGVWGRRYRNLRLPLKFAREKCIWRHGQAERPGSGRVEVGKARKGGRYGMGRGVGMQGFEVTMGHQIRRNPNTLKEPMGTPKLLAGVPFGNPSRRFQDADSSNKNAPFTVEFFFIPQASGLDGRLRGDQLARQQDCGRPLGKAKAAPGGAEAEHSNLQRPCVASLEGLRPLARKIVPAPKISFRVGGNF